MTLVSLVTLFFTLAHCLKKRHERHERHGREKNMKNVQISQDLFCDLILYHLYNNPSAEESIRRELSRKLDAMLCHPVQNRRNRSRT